MAGDSVKTRVAATVMFIVVISAPARAASMAIGWNTWLNWWSIPHENMEQDYVDIDFSVVPAFMLGPILSFQITPQWSLSSLFLMGLYEETIDFFDDSFYKIYRYDSDTTVSYAFTTWFRLYLGFKYFRYTWKYTYDDSLEGYYSADLIEKMRTVSDNFAPGAGFIFNIHLIQYLYLIVNAGALFSFTLMDQHFETTNYETDSITYKYSDDYFGYEVGLNTKLSFCYDIEPIGLMITTGFRYQVFFYYFDRGGTMKYSGRVDYMYGIDVMTIFYFDITR